MSNLVPQAPLAPTRWPFAVEPGIDPERFRMRFYRTWQRLPATAREQLLPYVQGVELWDAGPPELVEWGRLHGPVYGGFQDGSCRLAFSWRLCGRLSQEALEVAIAHELAHAFGFASGLPALADDEEAVDRLLSSWGFDATILDAAAGWRPGERHRVPRLLPARPGNPWQLIVP